MTDTNTYTKVDENTKIHKYRYKYLYMDWPLNVTSNQLNSVLLP